MILFYDVISKSVTGIKMLPTLGEEFYCSICEVTRFNRRQNWIIKWKKESIIKEKSHIFGDLLVMRCDGCNFRKSYSFHIE